MSSLASVELIHENIEDIGQWLSGSKVSDDRFVAIMPFARLMTLVPDPLSAADPKFRASSVQLADYYQLHEEIQRAFDAGKKANAYDYAQYILRLSKGEPGDTPTIDLYTPERLRVQAPDRENPRHRLLWPHGLIVVPYDGETQLAARFLAAKEEPRTKEMVVIVTIRHGIPVPAARQCFHDRNAYQRKAPMPVALAMDTRDPWIEIVRRIERDVPGVKGAIVWKSRQMPAKSKQFIAAATFLRTAVSCFSHGISGVQGGPAVLPTGLSQKQLEELAIMWFSRVVKTVAPYMKDREKYVASSPAIWAALGAMGNKLIEEAGALDPKTLSDLAEGLILKLKDVNWSKGDHWVGIAIKSTPKGYSFAGGAKDSGSVALKALTDPADPNYQRIRS